jgi:hypothetical protein
MEKAEIVNQETFHSSNCCYEDEDVGSGKKERQMEEDGLSSSESRFLSQL